MQFDNVAKVFNYWLKVVYSIIIPKYSDDFTVFNQDWPL